MTLYIFYQDDLLGAIVGGVVMATETAYAHGIANADYCAGILAMAKQQALAYRVPWSKVEQMIRDTLSADMQDLLDVRPGRLDVQMVRPALESGEMRLLEMPATFHFLEAGNGGNNK